MILTRKVSNSNIKVRFLVKEVMNSYSSCTFPKLYCSFIGSRLPTLPTKNTYLLKNPFHSSCPRNSHANEQRQVVHLNQHTPAKFLWSVGIGEGSSARGLWPDRASQIRQAVELGDAERLSGTQTRIRRCLCV